MNKKVIKWLLMIGLISIISLGNTTLANTAFASESVDVDPGYAVDKILEDNLKIRAAEVELANARLTYQENLSNSNNSRSAQIKTLIGKIQAEEKYRKVKNEQIYSIINDYFKLYQKTNQLEIAKKKLELEKRKLKEIKAEVKVGYKNSPEKFEQENLYHNTRIELENLKRDIALAISELKMAMGIDNNLEIRLIKPTIPEKLEISQQDLIDKAVHNRSDIEIAETQINLARVELEKARVSNEPSIKIKKLKNNLKLDSIEYKRKKQELIQLIKRQFLLLNQIEEQIEIAQKRIEHLKRNQSNLANELKAGRITRTALMSAEVNLLEGKQRLLKSISDYYLTKLELKQIVGQQVGVDIDEITE